MNGYTIRHGFNYQYQGTNRRVEQDEFVIVRTNRGTAFAGWLEEINETNHCLTLVNVRQIGTSGPANLINVAVNGIEYEEDEGVSIYASCMASKIEIRDAIEIIWCSDEARDEILKSPYLNFKRV